MLEDVSEEHARKTVTMEPHPHGGVTGGVQVGRAACAAALCAWPRARTHAGTYWQQCCGALEARRWPLLAGDHATCPAAPAPRPHRRAVPRRSLPGPQAASIHPCQHANVMHKLAERVAGEEGEFSAER